MLVSILTLTLITLGGLFLTYLYDKEDSLLVRLCAGNVLGTVIFGLAAFILACFFYLQVWVVLVSAGIAMLPALLLLRADVKEKFRRDWRKAGGKFEGTTNKKLLNLTYYAALFLLLFLFFDRAMIEAKDGIYTGVAHNLGDLHFHLDAIYSFTLGQNFPPENPSYSGMRFTYPFLADIIAASLVTLGVGARSAMFWQNIFLAFSLVVLLETFVTKVTQNKLAGKIGVLLLLFSGGFGFLLFLRDFFYGTQDIFTLLWKLPEDYTIRFNGGLRWGNSLIVLFVTQRSLLLGMPLTLIVLTWLWQRFKAIYSGDEAEPKNNFVEWFLVGLFAGMLPLVHVHSLMVLFLLCGFLALLTLKHWKNWAAFLLGTALIAIPELLWATSGSATRTSEFIDWHFGWHKGDWNIFVFWIANTGLFLPLLATVVLLMIRSVTHSEEKESKFYFPDAKMLLLFYFPFAVCFIICNVLKLAPWEWDNIKVLIYWYVGSIPLVALLLGRVWELGNWQKTAAGAVLFILVFSGGLDVWRVVSKSQYYQVASQDSVEIAEKIKKTTEPTALFLNAPLYNSPVGLSGRRSLMRYIGHLSSHGIAFEERERDQKTMYLGLATSEQLMQQYNVDYVLIGPDEIKDLKANVQFFSRYPVIAEHGPYRVYKIKK